MAYQFGDKANGHEEPFINDYIIGTEESQC